MAAKKRISIRASRVQQLYPHLFLVLAAISIFNSLQKSGSQYVILADAFAPSSSKLGSKQVVSFSQVPRIFGSNGQTAKRSTEITLAARKKNLPSPISSIRNRCSQRYGPTTRLYNVFDTIGDMLKGGSLEAETDLPYSPPFSNDLSIADHVRTFAIKERPISFTGEDFDIVEITNGEEEFVRVRGAMLHLPGKDKMRMTASSSGDLFVVMDRVLIAATPSYDLYRHGADGTNEKIGWIEKKFISLMDTFDVYMEGKGGFGVTGLFKPTPAYRIEGDFLDRNFSFRNAEGKIVARANMDGWIQWDAMNHYQVQVAEGMDALLVLACVCCIDEEFDEEHQKKREG